MTEQPIEKPKTEEVRTANTKPFKLKDKESRQYVLFDLKKLFGFQPDIIVVEKVRGMNNTMILRAILPEAVVKEQMAREAEMKKKSTESLKKLEKLEHGQPANTEPIASKKG